MTSSANSASATVSGPVRRTGSFDLAYKLLVVAGLEGNEYPTSDIATTYTRTRQNA